MPEPPRDQPAQQPPPVQRLRIRYAKRGRLRFTSHRDFGRAFERAVNRARLPIAYSSGFSPHPRISYANASPTGAASEAEYLEVGLTQEVDPAIVHQALAESLPPGLDVLRVVVAAPGALADRLQASVWQIRMPGASVPEVEAATKAFLATDRVEVERMTKRGLRTFDCRSAVVSLTVSTGSLGADADKRDPCAILDVVVRHGTPAVRPDDILAGLCEIAGLTAPVPVSQIRLAQGPLDPETGHVGDPLGPDRDLSGEDPDEDR
ncbi:MAG: TIGR03936 family radical SAM-associated protein [Nocardioidaceae bacterium]